METVLGSVATALDQYEGRWAYLLREQAPPTAVAKPESLLNGLEGQLQEWDARLTAAVDLAGGVERELSDAEATVGRWQIRFTGWHEVIERG
jgi:hypothetical protein